MAYVDAILGSAATGSRRRRRPAPTQTSSSPKTTASSLSAILGAPGAQQTAAARRSYDRRNDAAKLLRDARFLKRHPPRPGQLLTFPSQQAELARIQGQAEPAEGDESFLQRLMEGGVVGLIDEDVSAAARKGIYGTEDPSAAQVALMTLPATAAAGARGGVAGYRLADAWLGRVAPRVAERAPFHRAYTRPQIAKEAALTYLGSTGAQSGVASMHAITGNRRGDAPLGQSKRARDQLLATDPFWRDLFR